MRYSLTLPQFSVLGTRLEDSGPLGPRGPISDQRINCSDYILNTDVLVRSRLGVLGRDIAPRTLDREKLENAGAPLYHTAISLKHQRRWVT